MIFEKVNLNPTGKKRADCVIRAIMKATGKTWTEVFKGLCEVGLEIKAIPNEKETYDKYLKSIGWEKQKMPKQDTKTKSYKRYTVSKFADENPKGTFIIGVANHMTVLVDGILYDTWNCGHKSIGNYWVRT